MTDFIVFRLKNEFEINTIQLILGCFGIYKLYNIINRIKNKYIKIEYQLNKQNKILNNYIKIYEKTNLNNQESETNTNNNESEKESEFNDNNYEDEKESQFNDDNEGEEESQFIDDEELLEPDNSNEELSESENYDKYKTKQLKHILFLINKSSDEDVKEIVKYCSNRILIPRYYTKEDLNEITIYHTSDNQWKQLLKKNFELEIDDIIYCNLDE